ncbi:hypothetical protein PVAP13_6KG292606 [Panicum virgatum]|uniref:Uncharacterized protein n=1 Tax=Panicum virgatum TaxID=38727 RepID=A0A8T0RI73_PANVG|nr:hypothetical protein PVAP13_6KG292606 [Panicum virgatum]
MCLEINCLNLDVVCVLVGVSYDFSGVRVIYLRSCSSLYNN